ncbi:MAG: hypothetical protein WA697_12855, partial [Pseudolabrys sp.]
MEAAEGWLGGRQATARKIRAALEKAGIEFIDENGGGQGSVCASAKGQSRASDTVNREAIR